MLGRRQFSQAPLFLLEIVPYGSEHNKNDMSRRYGLSVPVSVPM